jgi:hypothetical protein
MSSASSLSVKARRVLLDCPSISDQSASVTDTLPDLLMFGVGTVSIIILFEGLTLASHFYCVVARLSCVFCPTLSGSFSSGIILLPLRVEVDCEYVSTFATPIRK